MSKKLAQSVLEKIKKQKLEPRPRWHFVLKNGAFWLLFGLAALFGAKAVGLTLFAIFEIDFSLVYRAGVRLPAILHMIPLIWVIAFLIFIIAAITGLHHTKRGYKFSVIRLIFINLAVSFVLGGILYAAGAAERTENFVRRALPQYKGVEIRRERVWSQPQQGRLSGVIISVESDALLLLDDFGGSRWQILYAQAERRGPLQLIQGERVRILGVAQLGNRFEAEIISSWRPPHHPPHVMLKEIFVPPRTRY
ncbi:hypothetical protein COV82_03890 [Candidatus Peregrinibacteria bacterium CG11_big_fil_rev_8_21_14_0_20_46_8]|nr:MAG: hypothetical protein COV82_03890 [Candidatus Peregrinibacteria bacterium CG11_big_fil_rev_8_21_14_0_20_46_8]